MLWLYGCSEDSGPAAPEGPAAARTVEQFLEQYGDAFVQGNLDRLRALHSSGFTYVPDPLCVGLSCAQSFPWNHDEQMQCFERMFEASQLPFEVEERRFRSTISAEQASVGQIEATVWLSYFWLSSNNGVLAESGFTLVLQDGGTSGLSLLEVRERHDGGRSADACFSELVCVFFP